MQKSDVAYIKAMLWGIVSIQCCQYSELSDVTFWITIANIVFYGMQFIYYGYIVGEE